MKCPRCLQDNRTTSKFCEHCGFPFDRACAVCGGQFSALAKFCPQCGCDLNAPGRPADDRFASPGSYTPRYLAEKILTSRAALEGERKQVTVLFADLKGSMELLGHRDPEEARRVLDPVLELMMEAVHHYEGTVNQVMGDGIMALFGAPLAHEDHAVRACYAALRMQDRVQRHAEQDRIPDGVPIQIRIGLNSGDVVVRSIGNDLRTDYSAVGHTTHLAARMEQMAEPGSILATADTLRLAEGHIRATSLGRRPIRGLDAPVDVYAITGIGAARWRLEAAAARGLTGFVGRDAELGQLGHALQSSATGHGQVVGVVGEPGVGKSRLFHEFTRSERMSEWLVLRTGAASYGKATAYQPIIELLRVYFDLHGPGDRPYARDKIAGKILALDKNLAITLPALFSLLDVSVGDDTQWRSLTPRQRRQQTMDAVRHLLLRESQVQPVCLLFEDLHWIDSETQAFLDSLVDRLPTARILLLVNYRTEYRHEWGSKTCYAQLRIDPLPARSAEELLGTLVGGDATLSALKQALIGRTEGNPFFLEECVRTLAENGVLVGERGSYRLGKPMPTVLLPATVQAVLAARIDRLELADKRLLQCASVIGESVPVGLLGAVAGIAENELRDGLARLRTAEFVYDITLFPEPEYIFRHGLTCQVAYNSLLREQRCALHARIVDAIERLYPDRLIEHVERLAHHARRGELWDRAARYLRQAGAKAFAHSANREAAVWSEQALEVLESLPDSPATQAAAVEVLLDLRNAFTLLGEHERTLEYLRKAQSLADLLGDRARLGRALSFEVNCLFLLGEHERAIECARRARAVADELDDLRLRTVTDMYAGRAHLHRGDFPRAIEIFGGIVAALTGPLANDHLGVPVLPSVFARSHLVESLAEIGRFDESRRYADEAVQLAETTNHPDTVLWAHHCAGVHHLARGEVAAATGAFQRAYSLCREHDMPVYRPRLSSELGIAWALGGRAIEAVPMVQQAAVEAAGRRQTSSYSQVLLLLAEVYLLADRVADGEEAAVRALAHFRQQGERGHVAHALGVLGDITARQGSVGAIRAEEYYEEAGRLAEELGMRPLGARCTLGLARLLSRTGRLAGARPAFELACASFRDLGMSADLARAEAELAAVT
jgi:class 3 adenylate cyclase/tetratricopeptide (TPR) repeat protein